MDKTIKKLISKGGSQPTIQDTLDLHRVAEGRDREEKSRKRSTLKDEDILKNKLFLIYEYSKGSTYKELEDKYNYNKKDILKIVNTFLGDLVNMKESRILEDNSYKGDIPPTSSLSISLKKLKDYSIVNEEFLSLLSPPTSSTLTEEESLFSYLYVYRGDAKEALITSGLDIGLQKDKSSESKSYNKAAIIRSSYLKEKPNVSQYIQKLREERYVNEDISKEGIQRLLLDEIAVMKERGDRRDRTNLRQTIELLGKTIGAFTDRVEVHEVDPSKSLDLLIEMTKDAEVKELE